MAKVTAIQLFSIAEGAEGMEPVGSVLKRLRGVKIGTSLAINKMLAKINTELQILSDTRNKVFAEHGTPAPEPGMPNRMVMDSEKGAAEIAELLNTEIEWDLPPVTLPSDVEGLSADDLEILKGLVVIDGEEV